MQVGADLAFNASRIITDELNESLAPTIRLVEYFGLLLAYGPHTLSSAETGELVDLQNSVPTVMGGAQTPLWPPQMPPGAGLGRLPSSRHSHSDALPNCTIINH